MSSGPGFGLPPADGPVDDAIVDFAIELVDRSGVAERAEQALATRLGRPRSVGITAVLVALLLLLLALDDRPLLLTLVTELLYWRIGPRARHRLGLPEVDITTQRRFNARYRCVRYTFGLLCQTMDPSPLPKNRRLSDDELQAATRPITDDETTTARARLETFINSLLALGLRQGEALGLSWADLDLDAATLTVRRAVQRQRWSHGCDDPQACTEGKHRRPCPPDCPKAKRRAGRRHVCISPDSPRACPAECTAHARTCPQRRNGGLILIEPKSRAGRRTISLPPQLVEALRAHRAEQAAERLRAGSQWRDHGLVFAQPSGRPIDPSADHAAWKDLLADAGVRDARLHDARHTAATLLLSQGVPARVAMEILGHSQISLTLGTYSHVAPELHRTGRKGVVGLAGHRLGTGIRRKKS